MYDYYAPLKRHLHDLDLAPAARPKLAIQLGSGLADTFSELLAHTYDIPYETLYQNSQTTTIGHRAKLRLGQLNGLSVLVFEGRFHLYEGYGVDTVCQNVITAALLGCQHMIFCNAAGALNSAFKPGHVCLLSDHLNMTGENPLIGIPAEVATDFKRSHAFINLHDAYSPTAQQALLNIASAKNIPLSQGNYAGVKGPSLESSAERRMLNQMGADLVGMSTVNEVIMSRYLGLETTGLSVITNMATGDAHQAADSIEDILYFAQLGGQHIANLVSAYAPSLNDPSG